MADVREIPVAAEGAAVAGSGGSAWRRVASIARNTFREAVRDRVLYNLVIFVLVLTGAAIFLGELSAAQEAKIIVDMGLSAVLLFGVFIAVFVGVGLVYKEIERRTVYAIFAKPVGRGEFLVGKYLGLCLTLAVNVAVMGAGVSLAILYVRGGWDALVLNIWPALALIYVELMIVVAVALLFSSFSSPALSALLTFFVFVIGHFSADLKSFAASLGGVGARALSALLTFFVFVIGHFSADLKSFAASLGGAGARALFGALYYLLPNLSNYSYITAAAHGETPTPAAFFGGLVYGVVYVAVLLAAATLIFSRRNFK